MTVNRRRFLASTFPAAGAASIGISAGTRPVIAEQQSTGTLPPAIEALLPITAVEPAGITDEERWGRIAKAQRLMAEEGLDGIVMLGGTSMLYYADMRWGRSERTFALVLSREGQPAWVCPAFERERAVQGIRFGDDIRTWEEPESPYALISSILADRGIRTGRIGLEETTYYHVADGLGRDAPALTVASADPITRGCRAVKSPAEIDLMRHANRVTHEALRATFSSMEEGMTQRRFGRLLSTAYERLGYSGGGLVLFGENSAYPHGTDREEEIREGMVVLCDSGTTVGGYRSDMTRTAIFGEPSVEQRRVWTLVKDAQTAALEAAGPGVGAGAVDRAAREVIDRGGYGPGYRYFTHRVGHGIGMDGHEWHYLVEGNTQPLETGMTFSNEPGIYIYGSFGVRLEDIMVITEDGADLLTEQAGSPSAVFNQPGRHR
jgi:Xaa-Pro dipeptidase